MAIITASLLAVLKLITGLFTGSMALFASAVDSLLDILMSCGNFVALRHAQKPADADHPYGHGKFETAATLLQSLLIACSGVYILFESVQRLRLGSELNRLNLGIAVLTISVIASWFLSRHLKRVGVATESSALQADALHYATDVYSNLVLVIGLLAVKLLGWSWLDPLLSLGVGIYILKAAYGLLKNSMDQFLDAGLPAEQLALIRQCIEKHQQAITGYHNLRTRRSGTVRMIDFHLSFCRFKTIQETHDIADEIEKEIMGLIRNADITIHLEPTSCAECRNHDDCTSPNKT